MIIISKECAKEKSLKRYFTGSPCKYGHISERYVNGDRCTTCVSEWSLSNRNRVNLASRERYKNRKKIHADRMEKYYQENKDAVAKTNAKYRKENKESINKKRISYRKENRKALSISAQEFYRKNPAYKFTRSTLRRIEKSLRKGERLTATEGDLGYTQSDFKIHIESQFSDGMNWDNRSEWHIDHIKPLSLFVKEGVTDVKIINALDNLQPLWAVDNLRKGAKYEE